MEACDRLLVLMGPEVFGPPTHRNMCLHLQASTIRSEHLQISTPKLSAQHKFYRHDIVESHTCLLVFLVKFADSCCMDVKCTCMSTFTCEGARQTFKVCAFMILLKKKNIHRRDRTRLQKPHIFFCLTVDFISSKCVKLKCLLGYIK